MEQSSQPWRLRRVMQPIISGRAHFLEGVDDLPNFSAFFAGVYLISCPSLTTIEPIEGPVSSSRLYKMKYLTTQVQPELSKLILQFWQNLTSQQAKTLFQRMATVMQA